MFLSSSWVAVLLLSLSLTASADFCQQAPETASSLRNVVTTEFCYMVLGSTTGAVYGGDITIPVYSDFSTIATAAVHAGVATSGSWTLIKLTKAPGQASYPSILRNGIQSTNYGAWQWSYQVTAGTAVQCGCDLPPPPPSPCIVQPVDLSGIVTLPRTRHCFAVTASTTGRAWGTTNYTLDSDLELVVVHAGIAKNGEYKAVIVTRTEGKDSYMGSTANGVWTSAFGPYYASFMVENDTRVECACPAAPNQATARCQRAPPTLVNRRFVSTKSFCFSVVGSVVGAVWGNNSVGYTDDSVLSTAAVHARLARVGERTNILVTKTPGLPRYDNTSQNGVVSLPWIAQNFSYIIASGDSCSDCAVPLAADPMPNPPNPLMPDLPADCMAAPITMVDLRGHPSRAFCFTVRGNGALPIRGSGPYTDHSSIAAAAVHAGLLADGQVGNVLVTKAEPQQSYPSSTSASGLTSTVYGPWKASFTILSGVGICDCPIPPPAQPAPCTDAPRTMVGNRDDNVDSYCYIVSPEFAGAVWGTTTFTDDSSIYSAAVHAGFARAGVQDKVLVRRLGGQGNYIGSSANGVASQTRLGWKASFTVQSGEKCSCPTFTPLPVCRAAPLTASSLQAETRSDFCFTVVGSDQGRIWGTGIYTADSNIAMAAVHAGVALKGRNTVVSLQSAGRNSQFRGTTSNGVTSMAWANTYETTFQFDANATINCGHCTAPQPTTFQLSPTFSTAVPLLQLQAQSVCMEIWGNNSGAIWGSNTNGFTADSNIATAAVHAGLVNGNAGKCILLTKTLGLDSYPSVTNRGITSSEWGSYHSSFTLSDGTGKCTCPGTISASSVPQDRVFSTCQAAPSGGMVGARGQTMADGQTPVTDYCFTVYGRANGRISGSQSYTDDSDVATAAVHSGTVLEGQWLAIRVILSAGTSSYLGTTQNNVVSSPSTQWRASYQIADGTAVCGCGPPPVFPVRECRAAPYNMVNLREDIGTGSDGFCVSLRGDVDAGFVFGGPTSGVPTYTDDSAIASAAVHAGLLLDNFNGKVLVTRTAGRASYPASTVNGVASKSSGSFKRSYTLSDGSSVCACTDIDSNQPYTPVGIRDPAVLIEPNWWWALPQRIIAGSPATIVFRGYRIVATLSGQESTSVLDPDSFGHVFIKASVNEFDCAGLAPGSASAEVLGRERQAQITVSVAGRYRLCAKHRIDWEPTKFILQVEAPDSLDLFWGSNNCEGLLRLRQDLCGCFFQRAGNGRTVNTRRNTPSQRFIADTQPKTINMGCCSIQSRQRTAFDISRGYGTGASWGYCKV